MFALLGDKPGAGSDAFYGFEFATKGLGSTETAMFGYGIEKHVGVLEHMLLGIFDAEVGNIVVVAHVVAFLDVARQVVAVGAEGVSHVDHTEVAIQKGFLYLHHFVQSFVQALLYTAEGILVRGVAVGRVVVGIVYHRVVQPLVGVDEPVLAQGTLHIVEVEGSQSHQNDAVGLEVSEEDIGPGVVEEEITAYQNADYHHQHQTDEG